MLISFEDISAIKLLCSEYRQGAKKFARDFRKRKVGLYSL